MPFNKITTFAGMQVYKHPNFTIVPRSLKERWFSWPWRPWVTTKQVPNPLFKGDTAGVIINNALHVTEDNYIRLMNEVNKRET